jgi:hypothetical protein
MDNIIPNHQNSPDAKDDDNPTALFDAVMRLLDTTPMLSDYDEELCLSANQINIIVRMEVSNDEKMALINDLLYALKSRIAGDVVKYHETSRYHADVAKQALED